MKQVFKLLLLSFVLLLVWPTTNFAQTDAVEQVEKKNVVLDKVWKITMNREINPATITKDNVMVVDDKGNNVNVSLLHSAEEGIIKVYPSTANYKPYTTYTLVLTDNIKDIKGKSLKASTMKFTTNNSYSSEEKFVENVENIVDLKSGITMIEQFGQSIQAFDEQSMTILKPSEELAEAAVGEIIVLPPTDQYPFGFAVEIKKKIKDGDELTLQVEQPKLEEVLEAVDIAATIPMSALINLDDIEQQNVVATTGSVAKDTHKEIDFKAIHNDDKEIEGFKVVLNNYEFAEKAMINGEMGFTGNISIIENKQSSKVVVDVKVSTLSQLSLNHIQIPKTLKYSYPLVKNGLQFRIPQSANLLGVSLNPALVFELKGHLGTKVNVETVSSFNVSAKLPKGDEKFSGDVNVPTTSATISVGSVNAEGSAKAGLELPFSLLLMQYDLATLGLEAGVKAEFKGYLQGAFKFDNIEQGVPTLSNGAEYCLDSNITAYVGPYFTLGEGNDKYTFLKSEKDLVAFSACKLESIALANAIEVDGYSKIDLPIKGVDLEGNKKTLDVYDEKVRLKTNDKLQKVNRINFNIFNINKNEFNYMLKDVEVGEKVKTTVSYYNGIDRTPIDKDVTLIARGNVRGKVVNENNKAMPNATVSLYKQVNIKEQLLVEQIKTDSKGNFEFMAPDSLYALKVTYPGYEEKMSMVSTLLDMTNEKITLTKEKLATYKFVNSTNKHKYVQLTSPTLNVKSINTALKQPVMNALESEKDLKALSGEGNYISVAKTSVTYQKNNLLGLRIEQYNDFRPLTVSAFLIDLKTAKRITISDVFKTKEQRNTLVDTMKKELRKLGEPQKNPVYREDRLVFNPKWGIYASSKGYVIVESHENEISDANIFDVYEITVPFSMGVAPTDL